MTRPAPRQQHGPGPLRPSAGGSPDDQAGRHDGRPRQRLDRPGRPDDQADDRGIATVWAATAVAVLVVVLAALLDLAGAVAARHRAESAADLAALAAAVHALHGGDAACARATAIAAAGGGRTVLCRMQGGEAVVEVEVPVRPALIGTGAARGRARAGPVAPGPPDPLPEDPG